VRLAQAGKRLVDVLSGVVIGVFISASWTFFVCVRCASVNKAFTLLAMTLIAAMDFSKKNIETIQCRHISGPAVSKSAATMIQAGGTLSHERHHKIRVEGCCCNGFTKP
jgi:hypothetical protein